MNPGELFGIGSQFAGSLISGNRSSRIAADNRQAAERHAQSQEALQREFAQHGVRWKVEDAKAAGLHPLFALGGATTSYSPTSYVGDGGRDSGGLGEAISGMGQNVSRAVQAQETAPQREQRVMGLQLQASQIRENDARALYYQNEAARSSQSGGGTTAFPVADLYAGLRGNQIVSKPDEVKTTRSDDPSMTAGTHAAMQEYVMTPSGLKMRLPQSDEGPGEAMENVPWYLWPAMIQHNRSYYGGDWGTRFLKEFVLGKPPVYRQHPSPNRQRVTGRIIR